MWGPDVELSASFVANARGYHITRNGSIIANAVKLPLFIDVNRSLAAGTYTYSVSAIAADGSMGDPAMATITIAPPASPKVLSYSSSAQRLYLAIEPLPKTVTSWQLLRSGRVVAQMSAQSTKVAFLMPIGAQTFTVRAFSASGVSAQSAPFTVTIKR